MSVNRYEFEDYGTNESDGRYVTYEDYAVLEARCAALAAENAGLKAKGRELLGEACAVCAKFNKLIDPEIGDFIDGQTLREFQYVLDCETPATDAFMAEVRASAIEHAAAERWGSGYVFDELNQFATQLRKGVQS